MDKYLDSFAEEPFIPFTPIIAFPQNEHGDVYPTRKVRSFDYQKDAKKVYRPRYLSFRLKRLLFRSIGLAVGEPVVYFRYLLHVEGRNILREHKKELRDGFLTMANHVFPLDCLAVSALRPFRVPEFPMWQDGFESSQGAMMQAYGGFPVVKTPQGYEQAYRCMKDVLLEKKWLHVYPEAACWYYYVPIREFLAGAFRLAYETKRPIFPLAFSFRKRRGLAKLLFRKEPLVTLRVGEPIYADQSLGQGEAILKLRNEVHSEIVRLSGLLNEEQNQALKKRYSYR
jgi:1-acyl-sn-glycerol-3-phosphate acyltransferase